VVQHQARKYGETKFGMERFINGFLDLITIWFLSRFGKETNAFICNGIANVHHWFFLLAGYIGVSKLYHMFMNMRYSLVTNNPWFFYCLNHHGNRYSVIFGWFSWRNHFTNKEQRRTL
jgi:arginine exporter protein ArgO